MFNVNDLTPEQLYQLSQMTELDDKQRMLERQMQMAKTLRSQQYSTPKATRMGGIADLIGGAGDIFDQIQMAKLLRQQTEARNLYGQGLRDQGGMDRMAASAPISMHEADSMPVTGGDIGFSPVSNPMQQLQPPQGPLSQLDALKRFIMMQQMGDYSMPGGSYG